VIRTRWILASVLLPALISLGWSQRRRDPLTRPEVDQLRDTAWEPELRLKLYIKFARARLAAVEQVRSENTPLPREPQPPNLQIRSRRGLSG